MRCSDRFCPGARGFSVAMVALGFAALGGCGETSSDPPPERPLPEVAAAAATVAASCLEEPVERYLRMVYAADPRISIDLRAAATCLAEARDGCAAMSRCLGVDVVAVDACDEGCTDGRETLCGGGLAIHVDCPAGWACDLDGDHCVPEPLAACDRGAFEPRCEAGRPISCRDGTERRGPLCAAYGLTCVDGDCRGAGDACDGSDPDWFPTTWMLGRCDGDDALVTCSNFSEHRQSCSAIAPGFRCHTFDGVGFCGLGAECAPYASQDTDEGLVTCDADALAVCHAGVRESVSCTALGFDGCLSEPTRSRCTPSSAEAQLP